MKTERVTLLTSPEFKAFLNAEARREGVSVAELVRTRCERRATDVRATDVRATDEEAILGALTGELNKAVGEARKALKDGLDEAQAVLTELRAERVARAAGSGREAEATAVPRSRKSAGARG